MNSLRRAVHMVIGHRWERGLVDVMKHSNLMFMSAHAGCFSTCRCGAVLDDLSAEARAHFLSTGDLLLQADGSVVMA